MTQATGPVAKRSASVGNEPLDGARETKVRDVGLSERARPVRLPLRGGESRSVPSRAGSHLRLDATPGRPLDSLSRSVLVAGDAAEALGLLPSCSVQTVVTSPPYWSLRDYEIAEQIGCNDGLSEYVKSIVVAFDALRRVLADDGTVWLNVGDSYTSGNRKYRAPDRKNRARAMPVRPPTPAGLKPKDLIGVPWRLAFALQDAGWWVRSEVVWYKPNAHPESVRDRPTKSHETIFLLSKNQDYFYDVSAVRGPNGRGSRGARHPAPLMTTTSSATVCACAGASPSG